MVLDCEWPVGLDALSEVLGYTAEILLDCAAQFCTTTISWAGALQPPSRLPLCYVRYEGHLASFSPLPLDIPLSLILPTREQKGIVTLQVRVLATNFGPASSAAAPSIRGFFQQAAQTAKATSASNPKTSDPMQRGIALSEARAACLLPAPDLANPLPDQMRRNAVVAARGRNTIEQAEQSALDAKHLNSGITPADDQIIATRAKTARQPAEAVVNLGVISVAEQASILAGIQRRSASHSTAAPSSKASGKRSRQGGDAMQGQEAQSALQQPGLKQRRISDVFKRVQQT